MRAITSPPSSVYTADQLMAGYRDNASHTITETFTFHQYLAFLPLQSKGLLPGPALAAVAAHDSRGRNFCLITCTTQAPSKAKRWSASWVAMRRRAPVLSTVTWPVWPAS